jgi:hypothetical protein
MHESLLGDSNRERLRAIQAGLFETSSCVQETIAKPKFSRNITGEGSEFARNFVQTT